MRKVFLLNILFLICVFVAKSQTVTIGTGASVQRFPLGNYFGFERSASIYTNTEIGTSGIINKLAWYATISRTANIPIKIYLKEITSTTFTASTWSNLISGATLVYDATNTSVAINTWNEFNLSTTFTYGGTNNLLVMVEANYGTTGTGTSSGAAVKYTSVTNAHQYFQVDNTAPAGNGTVGSFRPNIQITLVSSCAGTPPTATFTHECASNYLSYAVKVNVANLGSATGVDITDGVTVYQNNVGLGLYTISGLATTKNIYVQDHTSASCRISQSFVECNVCSSNPSLPTDECINAPMIDLSKPFAGSTACSYTVGSSYTSTLSACGHSLDNDSWMKFTAASTEVKLEFKVGDCTKDDGVQLAVFSGNCGALTLIPGSCENPSPTPNENTTKVWNFTGLTVGNEYFVRIDGYAGDECPYWFTPISGVAITPENDSCHKAFNLACGGKDTADILYATADVIPNCAGGGGTHRGLWYKVIGTGSAFTVDTDDALTNFDTEIAVYTGTCAGLTCLGANQNISGANTKSSYTWTTTAGEIYYIFVDGNGAAEGTFVVKLSCVAGTAPTINTNPSDENVCSSTESVSFSIFATDASSYQWQIDNSGWTNLSNGGVYSGVFTNTLNISSVSGLIGKQYRCIATNANGNTNSNAATIIGDSENPVITSTHNDVSINANASCQASLPSYVASVIATDNCGVPTITQSPASGTTISGATNTITLTATDGSGNTATKTFNVSVVDNTNPVITSTHSDVSINANASCQASLPSYVVSVTATDNCGAPTITQAPAAGTTISGATNTVTLTATDGAGNTATKTFNVEVVDNTNPLITSTHSDVTINANASCEASLPSYAASVTATDNCGVPTITQSPAAGTTIYGATNTITLTATDGSGNTATKIFNVTVVDNTNPLITSTHSDVSINANSSCQASLPSYLPSVTATDNCGTPTITQSPAAGTTISGTTNTVTLTATDGAGNTSAKIFNVAIVDNTAPVANIASLVTITEQCSVNSLTAPTAIDNCDGIINATHNKTLPITSSTTITWTYIDSNGNSSSQIQNVVINDNTAPVADVISLPNITAQCSVTSLTTPTATDNCRGTITGTHNATLPIITQGTTVVTWTYTDTKGNSSTQTQNIIINDNIAPVADISTLPTITDECVITTLTAPTATDNCSGIVTGVHNIILPIVNQGFTTITWTYTDSVGNTSTQNQTVIINDNTAPVVSIALLPNIVTECAVNDFTPPTAIDNCSGLIIGYTTTTFPITAQGTTVVTWIYKDTEGNTSTQNQNVTIDDNTAPIANITVLNTLTQECSVNSLVAPTATDNCGEIITGTHNEILPITESKVITWTYTDANGNSSTQTQNIVISDVTPPIPNLASLLVLVSECPITSLAEPTAEDACSGHAVTSHNAILPITSSTTITWKYTDASGNFVTQNQQVIIDDITAPVANISNLPDINDECSVTSLTAPTATDNCNGVLLGTHNAILPITNHDTTFVTWTYTDVKGNISTQIQRVIIKDVTAPLVNMASLPIINVECALENITAPTATDNCEGLIYGTSNVVLPISRKCDTIITWTFADSKGNTSTQNQFVSIKDLTAPVASIASLSVLNTECSVDTLISPKAIDNCYGEIIGVSNADLPITQSTTITWIYTDNEGNKSIQTQSVIINDITAPIPDLVVLPLLNAECLLDTLLSPTATDNCSGKIIGTHNKVLPITSSTTVTWTFKDNKGNVKMQTQNVLINDVTAPVASLTSLPVLTDECSITSLTAPKAIDNCKGEIFGKTNSILPITESTIITWIYADGNGNNTTQTQNVVIEDVTAPVISNTLLPDIYADCIVSEIDIPTVNDNCAGIISGTANIVLPYKNQGDTTITWTFVDKKGNKSTQNQNIRIEYSDCNDYFEVPTAFSPNNDGVNDVLFAVGRNIASFRMEVYNRYGLKVFETESIKEGWNGLFNGEIAEQAVYFYQVYYRTSKNETITKKGNVTLLK